MEKLSGRAKALLMALVVFIVDVWSGVVVLVVTGTNLWTNTPWLVGTALLFVVLLVIAGVVFFSDDEKEV